MMQASIEVVLDTSRKQQFLSVLLPLLEPTRCEAGCLYCAVWNSMADNSHYRFLSEWDTPDNLNHFLKSARFREILVAVELSEQEPDIEINAISESRDFDYILELLDN